MRRTRIERKNEQKYRKIDIKNRLTIFLSLLFTGNVKTEAKIVTLIVTNLTVS